MPPHCDTLDGPVGKAAKRALQEQSVEIILPYVPKTGEAEVRNAFEKVLQVRKTGGTSREIADLYFFETVVRIHRAGEGAAYTGLKPAGLDEGPVIPVAEQAIVTGSSEVLIDVLSKMIQDEINRRFHHMKHLQMHAERSVEDARAYVEAMLGFQVYSHALYASIYSEPHAGHHEH